MFDFYWTTDLPLHVMFVLRPRIRLSAVLWWSPLTGGGGSLSVNHASCTQEVIQGSTSTATRSELHTASHCLNSHNVGHRIEPTFTNEIRSTRMTAGLVCAKTQLPSRSPNQVRLADSRHASSFDWVGGSHTVTSNLIRNPALPPLQLCIPSVYLTSHPNHNPHTHTPLNQNTRSNVL